MSVSAAILKETDILLKALLLGAALIFVYDILRIGRGLIPHGNLWTGVEDFLFWLGSAAAIFVLMYRENDGYVRGFAVGGVVAGMLLYSLTLSPFVVKGSVFLLRKTGYLLTRPLVWLGRLARRPVRALGRRGRKAAVFFKKRLKKMWKAVKMGLCKL